MKLWGFEVVVSKTYDSLALFTKKRRSREQPHAHTASPKYHFTLEKEQGSLEQQLILGQDASKLQKTKGLWQGPQGVRNVPLSSHWGHIKMNGCKAWNSLDAEPCSQHHSQEEKQPHPTPRPRHLPLGTKGSNSTRQSILLTVPNRLCFKQPSSTGGWKKTFPGKTIPSNKCGRKARIQDKYQFATPS